MEMFEDYWKIDEKELNKQIFKEFNKTKEDLEQDINIVRQWAKTQPHFPEEPSYRTVRTVILLNKFSIEKSKKKLDMYYTIRSLMPEFYKSLPLSPETVLHSRVLYCVPLPKPTPDFKRIIYLQINPNFGPEFFDHEKSMEISCNLYELMTLEDRCYNFHYIFDFIGVQLGHVAKFNPMVLRKQVIMLEKVYSNRVASVYYVNIAKFVERIVNSTIIPMFSPKLRSRIQVHSDAKCLLEAFGKEVMPRDIGGDERSLDELTDCLLKQYEARKDRFDSLRTLRVDESLRPEKLVNDDVLGYYGNFKKLNVD